MTREISTPTAIEHHVGPDGRLSVKVADWDVSLVAGPGDMIRIQGAAGESLPPEIEVDRGDDGVSVRQVSDFPGIGFVVGSASERRRLTIDLPPRAAFNVQTASGDVAATGLRGEQQQFRTASGDLRLDAASGNASVDTVSGDIAILVDGSIELVVKAVSGDIAIDGGVVERLALSSTSGDIRLTSDLGPGPHAIATVSGDAILRSNRGLRITAQTVAGDLRSDLPHTSQGGPGRRSIVVGDGAVEVQFKSVSGDLRVQDPAAPANERRSPLALPVPPEPPALPAPPEPPAFNVTATRGTTSQPDEIEALRLEILQALETGQIDVPEATDRLARLDQTTEETTDE